MEMLCSFLPILPLWSLRDACQKRLLVLLTFPGLDTLGHRWVTTVLVDKETNDWQAGFQDSSNDDGEMPPAHLTLCTTFRISRTRAPPIQHEVSGVYEDGSTSTTIITIIIIAYTTHSDVTEW